MVRISDSSVFCKHLNGKPKHTPLYAIVRYIFAFAADFASFTLPESNWKFLVFLIFKCQLYNIFQLLVGMFCTVFIYVPCDNLTFLFTNVRLQSLHFLMQYIKHVDI